MIEIGSIDEPTKCHFVRFANKCDIKNTNVIIVIEEIKKFNYTEKKMIFFQVSVKMRDGIQERFRKM
jgi:hypothetical protein